MSYSWVGMGSSPCYVRLPNDNYLFSDGNHNLIEFNSRGIIKKISYDSYITIMLVDQQDNLWISTLKNGLDYYLGSDLVNSKKKTILQGEFTLVGDEDHEGGIRVYSRSKGLGYLANQQLEFLDNFQLRPDNSIVMSDLDMIFSNEKSIYQYDVKNNLFVSKVDFNLKRSISDLYYQKSNGVIWLTARQQIAWFKNGIV